jgi:hypothetical protein
MSGFPDKMQLCLLAVGQSPIFNPRFLAGAENLITLTIKQLKLWKI